MLQEICFVGLSWLRCFGDCVGLQRNAHSDSVTMVIGLYYNAQGNRDLVVLPTALQAVAESCKWSPYRLQIKCNCYVSLTQKSCNYELSQTLIHVEFAA